MQHKAVHCKMDVGLETAAINTIREREPVVSEQTLLNGVRFISGIHPVAMNATIKVVYESGSRREAPGEFGAMHFYEHLPPGAFRERNDGLSLRRYCKQRAWEMDIATSHDGVQFGFTLPPYEVSQGLSILNELLLYNREDFSRAFEIEKGRILNEEAQGLCDPDAIRWDAINATLYSSTGYAHPIIGNAASISAFELDQIYSLGLSLLTSDRATFIVTGDEQAVAQAYDFASRLPATRCPRVDFPPLCPDSRIGDLPDFNYVASEHLSDVQVYAFLEAPVWDDSNEYLALQVATSTLSDHIVDQLSDQLGITYGAYAANVAVGPNSRTELWTNVSSSSVRDALEVMRDCTDRLPDLLCDDDLVNYYRSSLNLFYGISLESSASYLTSVTLAEKKVYRSNSAALDQIKRLDTAYVREVARKYLLQSQLKFLFIGSIKDLLDVQTSLRTSA